MQRFTWPRRLACATILALIVGLGGGRAFALYDVKPQEIPGKPGTIIRIWPLEGGGPTGAGSTAFRVVYRSTGLNGEPIAVSGAIFLPPGNAPAGGRNVIAWAHPTSGVVEACAPSLMPDLAGTIWGLAEMLAKGYVVAATDYPGLGVPGIVHPYLIGESEGRAVLDSVRAARDLPNSGASNRFAVWGHSQGGHAALYAGELAALYAPDLKLVGVAAAAPATYLIELFDADKASPGGKELTAMALWSWSRIYHDPATSLIAPDATAVYEAMATDCIESIAEFEAIDKAEKPLNREKFLTGDPSEIEPWRGIMQKNSPGQAPAGAPVFLAQGTADTTVRPEITKQFGDALCKQGTRVEFVELLGVTHTFAAKDSAGAALSWMDGRFSGAPAPSVCGR
jgi:alpha-beta hydrolase superfamily lysophospholipase